MPTPSCSRQTPVKYVPGKLTWRELGGYAKGVEVVSFLIFMFLFSGREVVQTYFDIRRYKLWRLMRQAHFSNAEWFKELQCKVPEALREHKEEQKVDAADLEIDHDDENGQPSGKQASDPSVNN